MNYYQLNRNRLLEKAKDRYHNGCGKEKAAKHYSGNKKVFREKIRNQYRNLPKEVKEAKRAYGKNVYRNITEDKKNKQKE